MIPCESSSLMSNLLKGRRSQHLLKTLKMKLKEKATALFRGINDKFKGQFGFYLEEVSYVNISDYLYRPTDSSSLALTRILFGFLMLIDTVDERGGSTMDKIWGDSILCHFPLFPFLKPIPMPYMALVYAALWIGALGIMLGYKYRFTAAMFTISYWYVFLIEKSYWNNHSYLFGIIALILTCTEANCYWSIDVLQDPSKLKTTVPYWNYFSLKYQFFILYFIAGLKKGTSEWLTGYSVQDLSEHWVFAPFRLFLTESHVNYLIVHWFVFVFDLTISMWMMFARTRPIAVVFCCLFHFMNIRLFSIGMFPWVCLATLPLFFPFDWPKTIINHYETYHNLLLTEILNRNVKLPQPESQAEEFSKFINEVDNDENTESQNGDEMDKPSLDDYNNKKNELQTIELEKVEEIENKDLKDHEEMKVDSNENSESKTLESDCKKKLTLCLILFHVLTQAFLPYSHFITKGYNNWTDGLYGYSWDMMVHTWDTSVAYIVVKENTTNKTYFIDTNSLAPNDRWTTHGDMAYQYAKCIKEIFMLDDKLKSQPVSQDVQRVPSNMKKNSKKLSNISIYADVWSSMNGRFMQRIFDNHVDLLQVKWSPFKKMSFVLPLLDEALEWRETLHDIRKQVHTWNSNSDVLFQADLPGYEQNKFVSSDLTNVTLTVLKGMLAYETQNLNGFTHILSTGDTINVDVGMDHSIFIAGNTPAYFMYTFYNTTQPLPKILPKVAILTEIFNKFQNVYYFGLIMWKSIVDVVFKVWRLHLDFIL